MDRSATRRLGSLPGTAPANRHPNYPAEHVTLPPEPLTRAEVDALGSEEERYRILR